MLELSISPAVSAATPAVAQMEINYLLDFVQSSGCEFYRNGTWYDAQKGQAHLRTKYEYLSALGQINAAEDFIGKVATKSSMFSQPYQVKCGGREPLLSAQWLLDALAQFRLANKS